MVVVFVVVVVVVFFLLLVLLFFWWGWGVGVDREGLTLWNKVPSKSSNDRPSSLKI